MILVVKKNDEGIVLKLLKLSMIPLLYLTEDKQKKKLTFTEELSLDH